MKKKKISPSAHHFHDRGYKFLLSNLRLFQELMNGFVDQPWVSQLDFARAERVDKTFVLENFFQKESDILYRVPMVTGDMLYVYILVEHQSTMDHTMPFRVFLYIAEIWRDIFNNLEEKERNRADFRLPPVFPIVLYNGQPRWTAARRLSELIDGSDIFGSQLPELEYWFIDASHCDPEKLRKLRNAVAAVFTMEHRPEAPGQVVRLLKEAFSYILEEKDEGIWRTVWVWFENWFRKNLGEKKTSEFLGDIAPNVLKEGRAFMSPALLDAFAKLSEEKGLQKGLQKGRVIGEIQAIERVLKRPLTPYSELEGESLSQLRRIAGGLKKELNLKNS